MKKLSRLFLEGLLYIAPFAVTFYIIYLIFTFVDGLLQDYLEKLIDKSIPGLGVLFVIILLIAIGFLGETFIARPFRAIFHRLLNRAPLLKLIYSAFNDLLSAFVGKEKKFNKPVKVLMNQDSNLIKLGFLTEDDLSVIEEKDKVAVYFPHSYNFSGELFIVPRKNVTPVDHNPSDVMKFIVSGGVAGWEKQETE